MEAADPIRVLVNGAKGRMGREVVAAVRAEADLELAGESDLGDVLERLIHECGAQVVVDFTHPESAAKNTETILRLGACPVVGTTGFSAAEIERLQELAAKLERGGLIAPNFAIGAVLLMRFAAEAARYFPDVEVIELHHDEKLDSPSGTALKTVELIRRGGPGGVRKEQLSAAAPLSKEERESIPGVRGGKYLGIPIHSVRLPGYVAHEEVLFGGPGQVLSLRHDSLSRTSFMPGVILAIRKVLRLQRLYYGLEEILEL
jgi:4-hydroxy-tetrahydrodipicolinate reductase